MHKQNEPSGTVHWALERLIGLWCTNQPFRFVLQLTQLCIRFGCIPNVLVSYQLIGLFVLYVLDKCKNKNEPSGMVDWASERLIGLCCTNQPFRFVLQKTR